MSSLNFSPLMKTFTFNAWVVAGFTPISRGSKLDYYINRPQGMKGYIINLTLRGQARPERRGIAQLWRKRSSAVPARRRTSLRTG
jgi:AraC family transcriptional regulator of arabinose operon